MRLIDVNDVYSLFKPNGTATIHVADIDVIPIIDAVPVIRCKECKQWTGSKCKRFSFAPFAYCYTNPDDYCSRGERK